MDPLDVKLDQQIGLMKAMRFSDKDLEANRQGLLSDNQRWSLRLSQIQGALGWWMLAGLSTLPLLPSSNWSPDNAANRLMCLIVILACIGMAFWRQNQVSDMFKSNSVAGVTSLIRKTHRLEHGKDIYEAYIALKTFEITKDIYNLLQEGREYSFYFIPQTEKLLSIELLLTNEETMRFSVSKFYSSKKEKHLEDMSAEIESLESDETQSESLLQ